MRAMETPWTKSNETPTDKPTTTQVVPVKRKKSGGKKSKPFNRNTDGLTPGEIARAKGYITNVIEVPESIKKNFVNGLDSLTRDLTEFLVTQVAPFESALDAALDDAGQMLRIISGAQQADFTLGRSETIIRRLSELRTIDWVCNRLKMPSDIRSMVLADYMGTENDNKRNTLKELLKLHQATGVSRPQERPRMDVPKAQPRPVSRPTVATSGFGQRRKAT